MPKIETIAAFLEQFAPSRLAEEWDNVGLLVGDRHREVHRVMTCLTVTPDSAAEAVEGRAGLIVSHHPLPFRPLKQLTADTTVGRLLLELIEARIAVYSPHTAFDSAREGVNQRLAAGLGLRGIWPLSPGDQVEGAGRWGWLQEPLTLGQLADRVKQFLSIDRLQMVGDAGQSVRTVAVACGAAGQFLDAARDAGCDCMLIGETRFHTCLEAEAAGVALLLPGHFTSERFAVECLADVLAEQYPELEVWASRRERDPLRWA
ncbi:MAG TPA: Nif3-like dinuclear metal center hexameric protein [Thermoguttaceae bacterium]|nr:Nif3-like dinuclear metal center hexameric protein [Thermoguttaceae bacterium]